MAYKQLSNIVRLAEVEKLRELTMRKKRYRAGKKENRYTGDQTGSPQENNAKANTIDAKPCKSYGEQKRKPSTCKTRPLVRPLGKNNLYITYHKTESTSSSN